MSYASSDSIPAWPSDGGNCSACLDRPGTTGVIVHSNFLDGSSAVSVPTLKFVGDPAQNTSSVADFYPAEHSPVGLPWPRKRSADDVAVLFCGIMQARRRSAR